MNPDTVAAAIIFVVLVCVLLASAAYLAWCIIAFHPEEDNDEPQCRGEQ